MQIDSSVFAAVFAGTGALATIGGGIFFWGRVVQKLDEHHEARKALTAKLDNFIETFNIAAISAAKLETRIEHAEENIGRVDRTVEDLRRGDGWMTKNGKRTIDGPWPRE